MSGGEGNLRRITCTLGVAHETVANGVAVHADALPERPPQPAPSVAIVERAELFTFIARKKQSLPYHRGRPRDALYPWVGGGVGADSGRDAGLGRAQPAGEPVVL